MSSTLEDDSDKLSTSTITDNLKKAILVKLQELGAPKNAADESLCDYIMLIAVSKRKKKEAIIKDFEFILHEKSEEFVDWLLAICKKLNQINKKSKKQKKSDRESPSLLDSLTMSLTESYKPVSSLALENLNQEIDSLVNQEKVDASDIKKEHDSVNVEQSEVEKNEESDGSSGLDIELNVNTDDLPIFTSVPVSSDLHEPSTDSNCMDEDEPNVESQAVVSIKDASTKKDHASKYSSHERSKKRSYDHESSSESKRKKLQSTIQLMPEEPEPIVETTISSVVAEPTLRKESCQAPHALLLRAIREANKSTFVTKVQSLEKDVDIVKNNSAGESDENMSEEGRNASEDEEVEKVMIQVDNSQRVVSPESNLEDNNETNSDAGYFGYESDTANSMEPADLPAAVSRSAPSPTYIVKFPKDKDGNFLKYEELLKKQTVGDNPDKEDTSDRRIVIKRSSVTKTSRPRSSDDEREIKLEYKKFKYDREKQQARSRSNSYEEKNYLKRAKLERNDRDIDYMDNINRVDLVHRPTPPPYQLIPSDVPSQNNSTDNLVYYNHLQEWIVKPNLQNSFDLPPPIPPPMPPGFLPPPAIATGFVSPLSGPLISSNAPPRWPVSDPRVFSQPSLPNMLPSGQYRQNLPFHTNQHQGNSSSYEINVKVPVQRNDNLITVKCQNLDKPKSTTSGESTQCKFFPKCSKINCPYFHPILCSKFPNCFFGKNCVYQHPPCKYGAQCSRADCIYDHANTTSPSKQLAPSKNKDEVCKFNPNCFKPDCPYFHPKLCVYSVNCRNKSCVFYHPPQTMQASKIVALDNSTCKIANKFSLRTLKRASSSVGLEETNEPIELQLSNS